MVCLQCRPERDGSDFRQIDRPDLCRLRAGTVTLVAIWTSLVQAQIWSPVVVPSPRAVLDYLGGAVRDGTLLSASIVTLRGLLVGYLIGLTIGLPLGLLAASSKFVEDTIGVLALGLQTLPSVCWVPLAFLWFRSKRRRDVVCRRHGNCLVRRNRHRHRRAHIAADLCPRCANNGLRTLSPVTPCHP